MYLILKVDVEVQLGFEKDTVVMLRSLTRNLLTNGAVSGFLRLVLGLPQVFYWLLGASVCLRWLYGCPVCRGFWFVVRMLKKSFSVGGNLVLGFLVWFGWFWTGFVNRDGVN